MEFETPLENSTKTLEDTNANEAFIQGERGDSNHIKDVQNDEEKVPNGEVEKEEVMDILGNGQLTKKVLKSGEPDTRPKKPDVCLISYTGRLEDGTVVDEEDNVEIFLGDNDVIQGLDFALALMDKGEEAEVFVSPRFAYGAMGKLPEIPPQTSLTYNVILHNIRQESPVNELDIEKRISIGSKKKERGNFWFTRELYSLAIHSYRSALEFLDDTDIPGNPAPERLNHLIEERLKTYNNLGASQLKINAYDAALTSLGHVLSAQPKNIKALFRKAQTLKAKGDIEESITVVREGLSYSPENKPLQQELSLLLAAQRKDNTKQRNLYKKMMGNSTQQDAQQDKSKKTKSNLGTITLITAVGVAVAAIGATLVRYYKIT